MAQVGSCLAADEPAGPDYDLSPDEGRQHLPESRVLLGLLPGPLCLLFLSELCRPTEVLEHRDGGGLQAPPPAPQTPGPEEKSA